MVLPQLIPISFLNLLSPRETSTKRALLATSIPLLTYVLYRTLFRSRRHIRAGKVPKKGERILILGGTSGIGRAMTNVYAARGGRVCVVGRREGLMNEVAEECRGVAATAGHGGEGNDDVMTIKGDFTDPEDMVRVRDELLRRWGGLDTLIVAAGVSALQPLLAVAGADVKGNDLTATHTTAENIQHASDIASAAIKGNYIGPLVAAVTFTPLLSATSPSPSILLINSLASLIPAPTRTLYASSKSASLVLYQALSIEQPQIAFTLFVPSTVQGDFRASAVDQGPVREADPNKTGLRKEDVARRGVQAVDDGERTVFMHWGMRYAHLLFWIWPAWVERGAMKKYNFKH